MKKRESLIIQSLNIGLPQKEIFGGKEMTTGICKKPVVQSLLLKQTGFEGDGVGDLKHHGGTDKAVCVYSLDHYPYWEEILGIKLPPAAFGENLSVLNLKEDTVHIGDIFQIGTALLQISQPRQPCATLAARLGRKDLVKLVVDSGRTGFYFRVLQEGTVKQGDLLIRKERDPHHFSIAAANHLLHHDQKNCEGIKKMLALPALSQSWRQSFLKLKEACH